jgi:hypothetical protein
VHFSAHILKKSLKVEKTTQNERNSQKIMQENICNYENESLLDSACIDGNASTQKVQTGKSTRSLTTSLQFTQGVSGFGTSFTRESALDSRSSHIKRLIWPRKVLAHEKEEWTRWRLH